ncbi:MAG: hypothetical protein K6F27_09665 [Ruminococcus sp.]|nr:hypothetical protein [Ruminococcus sp.]
MNKIFVLVGCSGSGKTAISKVICDKAPMIMRILTDTTRSPRENETDGVDYNFVSDFNKDEYLEYTEYSENLYGTKRDRIEKALSNGFSPLLVMDMNGVNALKAVYGDNSVVSIYIHRNRDDVIKILKSRNLSKNDYERRITMMSQEVLNKDRCDYVVNNTETLECAAKRIAGYIFKENEWRQLRIMFPVTEWSCTEKEYLVCCCSCCSMKDCIHREAFRRVPLIDGGLGLCPRLQAYYATKAEE